MFTATSMVIHFHDATSPASSSVSNLNESQFRIGGGWELKDEITLRSSIVGALDLDDYVNLVYFKKGKKVRLYVGYYSNLKKVGAAHSPLVCMPGQGWEIKDAENVRFKIGNKYMNAHLMVAELNEQKDLIVYWYQAHDKSFAGTFKQKMYAFISKILYGNEKNAFVRVISEVPSKESEGQTDIIKDFLNHFYPAFVEFMAS